MKRLLTPLFFLTACCAVIAQAPLAFKYSAVAIDANNQPVTGTLAVRFSLLEDSENGPVRYEEEHNAIQTTSGGKFSLEVGRGTPTFGQFSALEWGSHQFWLRVELEVNGGGFDEFGKSQLLSVPYALYAAEAGANPGDNDIDPTNEIQQLNLNGQVLSLDNGGGAVQLPVQTLSLNGNQLTITGGGSVDLPVQNLTLNGNQLTITGGNAVNLPTGADNWGSQAAQTGATITGNGLGNAPLNVALNSLNSTHIQDGAIQSADLAPGAVPQYTPGQGITIVNNEIRNTGDADADPVNEIQQLVLNGNNLQLTKGGGGVILPSNTDNWGNQVVQTGASISGNGTVNAPLALALNSVNSSNVQDGSIQIADLAPGTIPAYTAGPGINIVGNQINNTGDGDNNSSNEIQTLVLAVDTIKLSSGGGFIKLPAEKQNLSLIGNQLSITNGSTIDLPTVAEGTGIEISSNGGVSTISALNDDQIWNAGKIRGRKVGGMEPSNTARVFIYDPNQNGGEFDYSTDDSDVTVGADDAVTVTGIRRRKIGGMEPSNTARVFVYDPNQNGGEFDYSSDDSDITVTAQGSNKTLTVSKIQALPVDFSSGIGDGMVLTCVSGNNGLQFECRTPNNSGFSLPYNETVNLNQTMFSITNNTSTSTGMQIDNLGRYGTVSVSREGQANFNLSSLNLNSTGYNFTFPSGVYGRNLNTSQAGVGVFGKAVSSVDDNEGIGGMFMGKSAGILAVGYPGGGGAVLAYAATASNGCCQPLAGNFIGDVDVNGTLSKNAGSFKIDHPLDPENKYLYHSFVESPDMMNIYNGNTVTSADGFATVVLPPYFETLNKDFRYQLTVIGTFAQAIIAQKLQDNQFVIQTDKPGVEVSWQITGIRKDPYAQAHPIVPEVDKPGAEKGTYLHPELYGQPATKAVHDKVLQHGLNN